MTNLYILDCELWLEGYHKEYQTSYGMYCMAKIPMHTADLLEISGEIESRLNADDRLDFYRIICDEYLYDWHTDDDVWSRPRLKGHTHPDTEFVVDSIELAEILNIEINTEVTDIAYTDPDEVVDALSKFKSFSFGHLTE